MKALAENLGDDTEFLVDNKVLDHFPNLIDKTTLDKNSWYTQIEAQLLLLQTANIHFPSHGGGLIQKHIFSH